MRTKLTGGAVAAAVLLAAPAALADKQIQAASNNRYTTPSVTMDQGEKLTFRNTDFKMHDVSSPKAGPDGKPLFQSPLIGQNQEATVEGAQYLTTGTYDFLCTVHPEMKGQITVTANGTPVPRPGTGGGGGTDTTAPKVGAKLKTGTLKKARKDRALLVAVTLDEAAKVTVKASAGGRTLGSKTASLAASGGLVRVKLDAADLRRLKGARKVSLSVSAADAAGNKARTKASRSLR